MIIMQKQTVIPTCMVDFILSLTQPHKEVICIFHTVGLGQLVGDAIFLFFRSVKALHGKGHFTL